MTASSRGSRAALSLIGSSRHPQVCSDCFRTISLCAAFPRHYATTATALKSLEGTIPSPPTLHIPPVTASTSPTPEYIIKSGILLSRPPILTRPQSSFEKAFFFYQKRLNERLALPFTRYFYFKKDTPADADWKLKVKERNGAAAKELGGYQAYGEMGWNDEALVGDSTAEPKVMREILARDAVMRAVEKEEGVDVQKRDTKIVKEQVELPLERHTEADEKGDVRRLDRKLARTLYLCVKRVNSGWGFPSGPLIERENLHQAAERVLVQTGGVNMNTWIVGHAPIGHHVIRPRFGADSALETLGEKTFFMKGRIMAGQADLTGNLFGLEDFKWLTKQEVQKHVSNKYFSSVKNMLADR